MNPTTVSRLKDILSGSQFDSLMRIMTADQAVPERFFTLEGVKQICLAFDTWQNRGDGGYHLNDDSISFDNFMNSEHKEIGGKRFLKPPKAIHVTGGDPEPQPTRYFKGCTFVATFKDETGNMHTFIELQANGFDKAEAFPLFIRDKEIEFSHNYGTNGALIFTTVIPPGL